MTMPEQGCKGQYPWITDEHRRRAVTALMRAMRRRTGDQPRLINDYWLGRLAGVPGKSRESIRRRARELRRELEADGLPLVSVHSSNGGSYLADRATDHTLYRAALEAEAKRQLARAARLKRSQAVADTTGQLAMFDTTPMAAGHRY